MCRDRNVEQRALHGVFPDGNAKLLEESQIIHLDPFLGKASLAVVTEEVEKLPAHVLACWLHWTDRRQLELVLKGARHSVASRHEVTLHKNLIARQYESGEGISQRREVLFQLVAV